jgi:tetratricopeptide (TPR) repeat protein
MRTQSPLKTQSKVTAFNFLILLIFVFLTPSLHVMAITSLPVIDKNNEGVESLEKEDSKQAYVLFLQALAEDPFNSTLRLNLGFIFEQGKEYQKAYQEYMSSHKYAETDEQRFIALFNAGNAMREVQNHELALKAYQSALAINPQSKEVKTNIELMWKGGGGGGQSENKEPNQGDQPEDSQSPQEPKDQPKPKPKEFDGKELTENDVKKILEELKNQEQQIRAKEYDKEPKSKPKDKDW